MTISYQIYTMPGFPATTGLYYQSWQDDLFKTSSAVQSQNIVHICLKTDTNKFDFEVVAQNSIDNRNSKVISASLHQGFLFYKTCNHKICEQV